MFAVCIKENFICTLNKKEIPIASCRADDNGAYIRNETAKKIFKIARENGRERKREGERERWRERERERG